MNYIENPKTKGSGIICAIPQKGTCLIGCSDCFFQSGRSYLEPFEENLPNVPPYEQTKGRIVRVNDGNDSNNNRSHVIAMTKQFDDKFYNTSVPIHLKEFNAPVVLTVNPGKMTDSDFHKLDPIPPNLMFVRIRANMWNQELTMQAADYYTSRNVPVVLTFMAYYLDEVPGEYKSWYVFKKRTLNSYWCLTQGGWTALSLRDWANKTLVYTCGKDAAVYSCARCGNCLREYYATKERMLKQVSRQT